MLVYGLTTCKSRIHTLLPATLQSLSNAGFPHPHIFADGCSGGLESTGCYATYRSNTIRTQGNWVLGMYEMYIRNPAADKYIMFQDDLVASTGLREYLEWCELRPRTYWNMYTFPSNQKIAPKTPHGGTVDGWYASNQNGRGALGLCFDLQGVLDLLSSRLFAERPRNLDKDGKYIVPERGHKRVDGGIVDALKQCGYTELVHSPSLLQHVGKVSSMGNMRHPLAESFRGEAYDLRQFIT